MAALMVLGKPRLLQRDLSLCFLDALWTTVQRHPIIMASAADAYERNVMHGADQVAFSMLSLTNSPASKSGLSGPAWMASWSITIHQPSEFCLNSAALPVPDTQRWLKRSSTFEMVAGPNYIVDITKPIM